MLNSQIKENVTQNDLNERLSRLLETCQSKNIRIQDDILKFQEKFEQESEVDQIEHQGVEDQSAENLTTNLNLEE